MDRDNTIRFDDIARIRLVVYLILFFPVLSTALTISHALHRQIVVFWTSGNHQRFICALMEEAIHEGVQFSCEDDMIYTMIFKYVRRLLRQDLHWIIQQQ
jgi:hypothetical protein